MQPQTDTTSGPIIVGIDHTAAARRAARHAATLAASSGRALHLVHAVGKRAVVEVVHIGTDRYAVDLQRAAEDMLNALRSELGGSTEITTAAMVGRPAEVLCAEARRAGASLIVLGRGRPPRRRRLQRPIADVVGRRVPCAVEIVDGQLAPVGPVIRFA